MVLVLQALRILKENAQMSDPDEPCPLYIALTARFIPYSARKTGNGPLPYICLEEELSPLSVAHGIAKWACFPEVCCLYIIGIPGSNADPVFEVLCNTLGNEPDVDVCVNDISLPIGSRKKLIRLHAIPEQFPSSPEQHCILIFRGLNFFGWPISTSHLIAFVLAVGDKDGPSPIFACRSLEGVICIRNNAFDPCFVCRFIDFHSAPFMCAISSDSDNDEESEDEGISL